MREDFTYPTDFAASVTSAWHALPQLQKSGLSIFPSAVELTDLLQVAYHATFLTEEGANVRFRLGFIPAAEKLDFALQHGTLHLTEAIPLSVGSLRKLALASSGEQGVLLISPAPTGGNRELQIVGLLDIGRSWWKDRTGQDFGYAGIYGLFVVASASPGCLHVLCWPDPLCSLERGKVRSFRGEFWQIPVLGSRFRAMARSFSEKVLAGQADPKVAQPMKETLDPGLEYLRTIQALIYTISTNSHGGSLLFVPSSKRHRESNLSSLLDLKYALRRDQPQMLQGSILDALLTHAEAYCGRQPEFTVSLEGDDRSEMERRRDYANHARSSLYDTIQFVSSLASVDGVLVLTEDLFVLGFGGEVTASAALPARVEVRDVSVRYQHEEIPTSSFGMRHRSVFRACTNMPKAVGVVFSQDADVRFVMMHREKLTCWQNIGMRFHTA